MSGQCVVASEKKVSQSSREVLDLINHLKFKVVEFDHLRLKPE